MPPDAMMMAGDNFTSAGPLYGCLHQVVTIGKVSQLREGNATFHTRFSL